jgi:hypothetical protein
MGHQNLFAHHNTNHWTHVYDMKLFGSSRYGVMAIISVTFHKGWWEKQTLSKSQLKISHGLALMGEQNLFAHHNTNHWTHVYDMKLFGSSRYGVMAISRCDFSQRYVVREPSFGQISAQNQSWLGTDGPSKSFCTPQHQSLDSCV